MQKLTHYTTVREKEAHWNAFTKLVKHQWEYGGEKYAATDEREMTDLLCEMFGDNGLLWTMGKYLGRFKNLGRERDLLKLACYCYILWLKSGFHLQVAHDEDNKKERNESNLDEQTAGQHTNITSTT